jgi:regulatory protein
MLGRKVEPAQAGDEGRALATAVHLLAIREHAAAEVKQKLLRKGFAADVADRVIQQLVDSRQLSDNRYVESFVRQHADRGQGPARIRAGLREVGIHAELIDQALEQADVDWRRLAHSVRTRKFGASAPANFRERAKQARFLQYRGFTHEQIRAALGGDWDAELDVESGI